MADVKISGLPASTTPLAGSEVLPVVQSGITKKVASDDLTVKNIRSNSTTGILQVAGPAAASTRIMTIPDANFTVARTDAANSFSSDQTLSNGNLVIGTSGKGIDFSAATNAAGMTSELLNDYEEGSWTPTVTSASGTITLVNATQSVYTKIGRFVYVFARFGITTDASVGTSDLTIGGLPFAAAQRGFGNLNLSNFSASDYGTGGAHGLVYVEGSAIYHVARTINISSRGSTFFWLYSATYAV